ncbi:MAG: aspartate/glutamate racemase family protein [Gemmatimonadota bacterium]|nr:MAG: aspartate/glutamate racemase family protein [Gemmatimonadota bacterium]
MKTIGLLGGMSWESTLTYYRLINEAVRDRLGGLHSAECVLYSVDFEPIERLQSAGSWDAAGAILADAARRIESAGADFLVLCTNTMHKVAPLIEAAIEIPLLHLADATGEAVRSAGFATVGLLGTRFTMAEDFYRGRLVERHGLEVLVPSEPERELIDRVIFEELCVGKCLDRSRGRYLEIIARLAERGAQAVILGCTEISLLVEPADTSVPLLDTTAIHAERAVDWALA